MSCYVGDAELLCEDCALEQGLSDDSQAIGGASDTPEHCGCCHRPLFEYFGLTRDGVAYAIERIEDALTKGTADDGWRWQGGYYQGLGKCAVKRDWCEHLLDNYNLSRRDERVLRWYMFLTEGQHAAQGARS